MRELYGEIKEGLNQIRYKNFINKYKEIKLLNGELSSTDLILCTLAQFGKLTIVKNNDKTYVIRVDGIVHYITKDNFIADMLLSGAIKFEDEEFFVKLHKKLTGKNENEACHKNVRSSLHENDQKAESNFQIGFIC
jgi:hypothetical protein